MVELWLVFSLITVFFLLLLLFQHLFNKKFCGLCGAVVLTWVSLLMLYSLGKFDNFIVIALLLGQSTLGIFYLAEKKVPEPLTLFRLPFLITLIFIALVLLVPTFLELRTILMVGALWLMFLALYFYRRTPAWHSLVKNIIECCKNW